MNNYNLINIYFIITTLKSVENSKKQFYFNCFSYLIFVDNHVDAIVAKMCEISFPQVIHKIFTITHNSKFPKRSIILATIKYEPTYYIYSFYHRNSFVNRDDTYVFNARTLLFRRFTAIN